MRTIMLLIAGSFLIVGCNSDATPTKPGSSGTDQLLIGEGNAESEGLSVTNGNMIIEKGRPGVAFAFAKLPGQEKQFAYFLVFNHDYPNAGFSTQSGGSDLMANASHTIRAFDNECKAEYVVELDASTKKIKTDSTFIGNSTFDISKGKLFLIDMKNDPPVVTQLNVELPAEIPNLKDPEAAEKFGEATLNSIRNANKTVDAFCDQIE